MDFKEQGKSTSGNADYLKMGKINLDAKFIIEEEEKLIRRKDSDAFQCSSKQNFVDEYLLSALQEILKELGCNKHSKVLDIACGSGNSTAHILQIAQDVVGIDISFKRLEVFKKKYSIPPVNCSAHRLPFRDETFDFAVVNGGLHHFFGYCHALELFLKEFYRILKPGGFLVANEPNLIYPWPLLAFFPDKIIRKFVPNFRGRVRYERPLSSFHLSKCFGKIFNRTDFYANTYAHYLYPLKMSKFITRFEDNIRKKRFFRYLGSWTLIYGQK